MPMEKEPADVHDMHSKKEWKNPKNNRKDSFECLPDRDDSNCSNSVGMVLLTLEAIPASPAVERSDFRKQTWQVPSLPTRGLTSSESLFPRSASASVLTQAKESQGICTSHQHLTRRTKQGFRQTNFGTALRSCLIYPLLGSGRGCVTSDRVSQLESMQLSALAYLDSLLHSDIYFAALLLTNSRNKTKINQTAEPEPREGFWWEIHLTKSAKHKAQGKEFLKLSKSVLYRTLQ